MSDAREHVLTLIRSALRNDAAAAPPPPPQRAPAGSRPPLPVAELVELVDLFIDRLRDYGASVVECDPSSVADALAEACNRHGARRLVIAAGLPEQWRPPGIELIVDQALTPEALDNLDGVITGAAAGIAQSGTIVLNASPDQGRRVLTLIPDLHLCVVAADQIVAALPDAVELLANAIRNQRPITFISGPSATADIELRRVQGVHGPRRLEVIVLRSKKYADATRDRSSTAVDPLRRDVPRVCEWVDVRAWCKRDAGACLPASGAVDGAVQPDELYQPGP